MKTRVVYALSLKVSSYCDAIAGTVLILVTLLTTTDVILRAFGLPIQGTYELVTFAGGVVIGFAVPGTFREKGHISVDFVTSSLPPAIRHVLHFITRLMTTGMCLVIAWGLLKIGIGVRSTGETTAVLTLSPYPLMFSMAGAFVAACFVFIDDLKKSEGMQNE